jgi:primosomal protein N' (replication factor Y)
MYAELVINIEASLSGTYHYFVPSDLLTVLSVGHLVEVEFGRRLAQGIIISFSDGAPVAETKPIIGLIEDLPVVSRWQIGLARWLSVQYLAPLNSCLRLMLPPGLTRWADSIYDIAPLWDGEGRITEKQNQVLDLLREKGPLRSRQISRVLGKKRDWKPAADQLVTRKILRRASVLDAPRTRPKQIRLAQLVSGVGGQIAAASSLGRKSKLAEVLFYLLSLDDPLPLEVDVLRFTATKKKHVDSLEKAGLLSRFPGQRLVVPVVDGEEIGEKHADIFSRLPLPLEAIDDDLSDLVALDFVRIVEQPDTISLSLSDDEVFAHAMRLRKAEKYYAVLSLLTIRAQPVPLSELYAETGCNISHLRRLERLDLIRLLDEEVWRDSLADQDFVPVNPPELTTDQARVWTELQGIIDQLPDFGQLDSVEDTVLSANQAVLLHGVTGSGKTEIYMRAIDSALARNQQAIVLVPEIALTPQTVRRFAARFPGRIALLHSRLSDGERYDTWRRARKGLFDIVIGPRSALFTPLRNVGVIVVDEEHDASYKQTPPVPPPYYHARDAAVAAGEITGAMVILGSATPDLVTYHRAQSGHYRLLELPKRVMGHRQRLLSQAERLEVNNQYRQFPGNPEDALEIPMPPVQVVDLRQELRAGNRSIFSRALSNAIDETLERGEQAILFLNRRGSATFVMCRDCGHVLRCPRCDMPLTYHRPHMMLICHHCGRHEAPHRECPQCGSKRIKYFGLGTEEVEVRVQRRWPQARITRWDRDTTAGKDTHAKLLARFINRESDILVGTQMIAKGLDLPFVTLVGVISADVSLGLPDYRTGERAFQILAQVAGRAGRGLLGGRVIIQTYQPDHYAVQAAAGHDYTTFYLDEIRFRTQHMLPPFRRLAKLIFADRIADRGKREADKLAAALRHHVREKALGATELIGPVPPFFSRVDGRYRWQIIVRSPDPTRLLAGFSVPKQWALEIDPVSTL